MNFVLGPPKHSPPYGILRLELSRPGGYLGNRRETYGFNNVQRSMFNKV